mmetsp:Transcript_4422/g.9484  ORF Transcript_4422/g.9484 Transcript_4422/m.9484 type:complete len:123 (-) Transcript_4422:23-391(-)
MGVAMMAMCQAELLLGKLEEATDHAAEAVECLNDVGDTENIERAIQLLEILEDEMQQAEQARQEQEREEQATASSAANYPGLRRPPALGGGGKRAFGQGADKAAPKPRPKLGAPRGPGLFSR